MPDDYSFNTQTPGTVAVDGSVTRDFHRLPTGALAMTGPAPVEIAPCPIAAANFDRHRWTGAGRSAPNCYGDQVRPDQLEPARAAQTRNS